MGIEIWTLLALVTVLAVYVLPFLVGRREVMGRARAEDRYSAELRILLTQTPDASADPACLRSGHVEIFRRRPEVRTMNRPAVRNVRALRTERELARARRARAQAVARRRTAASRRATVAAVLAGLTLGTWVVAAITVAPWMVGLIPTALLLASMVMGRRAALTGARADALARRRISQLERDLRALTGETAPHRVEEHGGAPAVGLREVVRGDVLARESVDASAAQDEVEPVVPAVVTAEGGPVLAEADVVAVPAAPLREEPTAAVNQEPTDARAEETELATPTSDVELAVGSSARDGSRENGATAPSTPPQGWHPVRVPAPTYTLAARAPRRAYADIEEPGADRAVVPVRPMTARQTTPSPAEADFHPIDLDAVLERRRAAGE